jgi:hypothetical protein
LDGPEASDTQAWSFDAVGRVTENNVARAAWRGIGTKKALTASDGPNRKDRFFFCLSLSFSEAYDLAVTE